jgi:DNA-directed RNA polymerase subunit M/transcription elongation factor TFIIS
MYYIKLNDTSESLEYYCRQCGQVEDNIQNNISVSKTVIKQNEQKFSHIINEYTKLDPTLPRINTLDCPNKECATNTSEEGKREKEIIYIRYDDINMKYIYLCSTCDYVWKLQE